MVPGVVEPTGPDPVWPPPADAHPTRAQVAAWAESGAMWRRRHEQSLWELGDWLLQGRGWDADLSEAIRITGYSKPHLINVRRVSATFAPWVRSYRLAHAAHLLLVSLPEDERKAWHGQAVEAGWTVDTLRQALQAGTPTPPATTRQRALARTVLCPHCGQAFELPPGA